MIHCECTCGVHNPCYTKYPFSVKEQTVKLALLFLLIVQELYFINTKYTKNTNTLLKIHLVISLDIKMLSYTILNN